MMVEAGGTEKAWQYYEDGAPKVTEEVIAGGPRGIKVWIKESIDLQRELVAKAGDPRRRSTTRRCSTTATTCSQRVAAVGHRQARAGDAHRRQGRAQRGHRRRPAPRSPLSCSAVRSRVARRRSRRRSARSRRSSCAAASSRRACASTAVARPTSARCQPRSASLPTAHGSGLFQRGETQVLNVCTLGMPRMDQLLDTLGPDTNKRYMHHYNMPPSANGETGRVGSPKRREIGHGLLAERALLPVVPSQEEFAYTLRLVSEVLASNGSTSMASVCSLDAVADGRRRADQGAGRRHRHGPRVRRGQVHDAHRHPRRRGRLRRHGLQGRRHGRLRHRPAARHQDRRHPRRRAGRRAAAGQGGPPADPRGHARRPSPSRAPRSARPRRRSSASRSRWTRSARSSGPRARSSTPSSRRPAPTSPSTTTAWSAPSRSARPTAAQSPRPGARSSSSSTRPPPTVGEVYPGRVVNITKFGAFVNILPGRDGLRPHLQARAAASASTRVEDVLEPRRRDRGAGRRHRPERQGLASPRSSKATRVRRRARATAIGGASAHRGSPARAPSSASARRVGVVRGLVRCRGPRAVRRPRSRAAAAPSGGGSRGNDRGGDRGRGPRRSGGGGGGRRR